MNNKLLRSILAGVLLGVALFVMPFFLVRLAVFFLVIGALLRLFGAGRFRAGWKRGYGHMPAFADRIRQMSDEEYAAFRQRYHSHGSEAPSAAKSDNPANQ